MNLKFWQSRWTRFQVEAVTVVSTGYICEIRSVSSGQCLNYFFAAKDIKKIEAQNGQGLRKTLVIKKAALRKRGLL